MLKLINISICLLSALAFLIIYFGLSDWGRETMPVYLWGLLFCPLLIGMIEMKKCKKIK